MNVIRVLAVEDDGDFRSLIQHELDAHADIALVGSASSRREAVQLARALKPDIVLMDLNLSGSRFDGIEASREIRLETDAKVIILTAFENSEITNEAFKRAFASGYVYKSQFETLVSCIRSTARGCTPIELAINRLILQELSNAEYTAFLIALGKDIALRSTPKTRSHQRKAMLDKLGLERTEEVVHLFGNGRCF